MLVVLDIPDNTVLMTLQCIQDCGGYYTVTQDALDKDSLEKASAKKGGGAEDEQAD